MIRLHFSSRWRLIYGSKLEVQMQRLKSDWLEQKSNQCSSSQCTERTAITKFTSSMCSSLSWQKFTLYSLRLLHFSKSLQIKTEKKTQETSPCDVTNGTDSSPRLATTPLRCRFTRSILFRQFPNIWEVQRGISLSRKLTPSVFVGSRQELLELF